MIPLNYVTILFISFSCPGLACYNLVFLQVYYALSVIQNMHESRTEIA